MVSFDPVLVMCPACGEGGVLVCVDMVSLREDGDGGLAVDLELVVGSCDLCGVAWDGKEEQPR